MLFFVGGERREEAGEGERARGREACVLRLFFIYFSIAFHGVPFFGVECKSRNHAR
jgi:hypothetical protein